MYFCTSFYYILITAVGILPLFVGLFQTDIWGLGCCVYEMMTLKRAFQGRALWALIREIKNGRNLEMPYSFSLEIRTLVQEMMSQKPDDRPSAKDIVQNDLLLYHTVR